LKGTFRKVAALTAVLAVVACATASAVQSCIGPLCVSATATVEPRELPKNGNAPIVLSSTIRVSKSDGSPPTLEQIKFLIDKHGTVNSKAFPVCKPSQLEGATVRQARQRCAGALIGKGKGKALVTMPGQESFTISSPVSFFNAPPSGGKPTMIVHAYETVPEPKALLAPVVIERVSSGRYGFRVAIEVPEIAGGFGVPTLAEASVGATRTRTGKKVGFLNAHCSGGRLQVDGSLAFTNGDFFPTTLTSPCHFPR
jgi:hypothetical protein